jgi:hypothetical protein
MEDYVDRISTPVPISSNYRKHTAYARLKTHAETASIAVKGN